MPLWKSIVSVLLLPLLVRECASAEDPFQGKIAPFLSTYCIRCHNAKTHEGELDLTRFQSGAALGEHHRQWETIVLFLKNGEMPPADERQPAAAERTEIVAAIRRLLSDEARKSAGDPGVVLPRRLSNAEFNYTVRDLTGVDIRPADSFPVDPASGEGFNNTGEALVITPNLFKKYYAAAQHVGDHVLLTPTGIRFAPFPVVTFADRVKYYEQAIIRFYQRHDVEYEAYLTAAWWYRHRTEEHRALTPEQWPAQWITEWSQWSDATGPLERPLSPKYFRLLHDTLSAPPADDQFYLGAVRRRFQALPPPMDPSNPVPTTEVARAIDELAGEIRQSSLLLAAKETPAIVSNAGNGPVEHIARRNKTAAERDTFDHEFLADRRRLHVTFRRLAEQPEITVHLRAVHDTAEGRPAFVILRDLAFSNQSVGEYRPGNNWSGDKNKFVLRDLLREHAPDEWNKLRPGKHPLGHFVDDDAVVLSTATPLRIKIPTAAFGKRNEIRFFVEAELDRDHSPPGAVVLAGASDKADAAPGSADRLIDTRGAHAEPLRASSAEFCRVFPNRFVYVDDTRGLSAGFHLIEGMFRDDRPLAKLVLDDEQNRELDRLWEELYFGTGIVEKMLRGFVFFERSERGFLKHRDFDRFKEEDPALVRDATLADFERVYLERSGVKLDSPAAKDHPIRKFFADIRSGLKRREAQWSAAEPIYRRQLESLAERAWRRPLTEGELKNLAQFYEQTCRKPEFGVEQAARGVVTSLLVSPHFCCRIDVPPAGDGVRPLSDLALASRLSYLIWSSMPDEELLALARAGKLNDEAVLREQTRRMLRDPKAGGFALEFFGQWLRYRDFLSAESVDRSVFPSFTEDLKQAMFEEPTRLITWLIQNDRPVTDLLFGDTTFVNGPLAEHYGWPKPPAGTWRQVDRIGEQGRGGVLGMAVFLTANSQPQRTSPVKRGFWVVHKILGEHIPPPPPDVAVLPAKETEAGQTVRQLLAAHTEEAACARCHRRFDPVGLSMEGFDPIGRSRNKDLAGRAIDNVVELPTGGSARGVPEFVRYLRTARRDDFVRTLSRKFLGYALGRSVELSDQELLDTLQRNLLQENSERGGDRFGTLFETVVLSPQFRNIRGRDFSLARFRAESSGD